MRPVQRPADGHAAPGGGFELPSASLVRKGLEEMLSEQGVEVLDRERILGGTFPKEVVTCRRSDGTTLRVFCKYEGDSSHAEYGHRGDVEYEELVYRTLLQRMRTATPRFIGSLIDGAAGGTWLAIEYAEGADRVNHVEDAIPVAARWLGGFHAETECILEAEPDLPLKRYDADYYVGWARRTLEFAGDLLEQFRWLRPLCERFGDAAELLLAARATVAHGEFYPANVLIKGDRIYAVDWESAAVAAGEIDLATLTFGWPDEDLARSLEQYCAVRWPSGAPPEFQARLDAARVYGVLRWLGDRGVWAPSWADLIPDIEEPARRLGLIDQPLTTLLPMTTPDGWSEVDGALQREFRFANFADALAFVNRVGELAEAENHHPDIELGWGRVVLRWRTHSADAITDRDRELATKSGALAD